MGREFVQYCYCGADKRCIQFDGIEPNSARLVADWNDRLAEPVTESCFETARRNRQATADCLQAGFLARPALQKKSRPLVWRLGLQFSNFSRPETDTRGREYLVVGLGGPAFDVDPDGVLFADTEQGKRPTVAHIEVPAELAKQVRLAERPQLPCHPRRRAAANGTEEVAKQCVRTTVARGIVGESKSTHARLLVEGQTLERGGDQRTVQVRRPKRNVVPEPVSQRDQPERECTAPLTKGCGMVCLFAVDHNICVREEAMIEHVNDSASQAADGMTLRVDERHSDDLPYDVFLRDYVRRGKPVVVQDAIADWPALAKWTPAYFRERFARKMVNVGYGDRLSFADFIDQAEASTVDKPGPYMYRLFLHEHLPEVLPDLSPQCSYSFPRRYASPLMPEYWRRPDGYQKLLIGGAGGRFPVTHFDSENAHATITEIYGDKEFILFPPSESPYMYPSPRQPNHSLISDPLKGDPARFPLFAKAKPYRTILRPGYMVFVPCGWWHTARALNMSISVGMNILDRSNWKGFVSDVSRSPSPGKAIAKKFYLTSLGHFLASAELLQERVPSLARLLALPLRLAPATSAVAPDPALRPLQIRKPTA